MSGASPLAKLLMIARDCWNLEPPIPASAISWLTAFITWYGKMIIIWGQFLKRKYYICLPFGLTNLQMWADYRFSLGKLKVLSHEKVKQGSCLCLGWAGTMVTALEDFITQTAAQVCSTLEECTGELQKEKRMSTFKYNIMQISHVTCPSNALDLLYKKPESSKDMP